MSRWWRAHDEAVDDPKLQQLPDVLFKAWFNICCITSQNGGTLPALDAIAFKLRTTPAKAHKTLGELRLAGLIDDDGEGNTTPHNWAVRQFKSDVTDPTNATRQKRFRNAKRNGDRNANTVTPTVTVTPTRDRAEQSSEPKGSGADAPPDPKTEYFRKGREILGPSSGGLLSKLLRSLGNEDDPKTINKALARILDASTKAKPAEWIGRVLAPKANEFKSMSGIDGVV